MISMGSLMIAQMPMATLPIATTATQMAASRRRIVIIRFIVLSIFKFNLLEIALRFPL